MEHSTLIHRERQMRRKRKLEAAAADQTPQDMAEQAAAAELAEACAEMDKPYTYAELRDKIKARKTLYECFEKSSHAAAAARVARHDFALHRATVEDASTMVDELLKTKEGRQRLKFQMQLYYGKSLFESWTDGNKVQAAVAPMFKGSDEESVTMATALKMATARRSDLSAAREHARNVLLEENKEECRAKAEADVAEKTAESEKVKGSRRASLATFSLSALLLYPALSLLLSFLFYRFLLLHIPSAAAAANFPSSMFVKAYVKAHDDLVGIYGGPETKWEKLLDANADKPFW
jgi:hypothetical protein